MPKPCWQPYIKDDFCVMQASMVQNPYTMGYEGVQAAVDLLAGKPVPRLTDTGVTVATKENADSIK
jgi:ribose transport system substrate-binding protein